MVGAIIDTLIGLLIMVPIMLATGVLQLAFEGEEMTLEEQVVYAGVGFVAFLVVNGYLLFKRGQTIGKILVKTRIVDLNGNIPNFAKIVVLRYLVLSAVAQVYCIGGLVGLVNALWIFGRERRCLHDYIAGTRVVEA